MLNGLSWQIIGIMPPRMTNPFSQTQIFAPRVFDVGGLTPIQIQNGVGYAQPIARLKPGVSIEQAQTELAAISKSYAQQFGTKLDANNTSEARSFTGALIGNLKPTFTRALFAGLSNSTIALEIEPFAQPGMRKTVTVTRNANAGQLSKRRGETRREVEAGIFYLDLDRLTTAEFTAALPKLTQARGLIFDMRGYPAQLAPREFFSHLTRTPLKSAQWHTPHIARLDHAEMNFVRGGEWTIGPAKPFLAAKRVFITDGRAISYAESCMGIVEAYQLGEIVGGATAGTNGNINTMTLPGRLLHRVDRNEGVETRRFATPRDLASSQPFLRFRPGQVWPPGAMNCSIAQSRR